MANEQALEQSDASDAEETQLVEVTVLAVILEFDQVLAEDAKGNRYAITRRTKGIELDLLREGQRITCRVTVKLPRVLSATLVS